MELCLSNWLQNALNDDDERLGVSSDGAGSKAAGSIVDSAAWFSTIIWYSCAFVNMIVF